MTAKRFKRDRNRAGLAPRHHRTLAMLWQTAPAPTRGPKAALTLDRLARAGIALADADGLARVSMSRVAKRVGVTPMALYRYVPGKTELVDLIFDTAMGTPPDLGAVGGGWRPRIETWARGLWAIGVAHPWALGVLARLRLFGPNELAWMECGARVLADAGLAGAPLLDALMLIVGHVRTVAQYTVVAARAPGAVGGLTTSQWAAGVGAVLNEHSAQFPTLVAAAAAGAFAPADDPLAFGLQRVLDGFEAVIPKNSRRRVKPQHVSD
jgi:AcrR family transcriptional regulator